MTQRLKIFRYPRFRDRGQHELSARRALGDCCSLASFLRYSILVKFTSSAVRGAFCFYRAPVQSRQLCDASLVVMSWHASDAPPESRVFVQGVDLCNVLEVTAVMEEVGPLTMPFDKKGHFGFAHFHDAVRTL